MGCKCLKSVKEENDITDIERRRSNEDKEIESEIKHVENKHQEGEDNTRQLSAKEEKKEALQKGQESKQTQEVKISNSFSEYTSNENTEQMDGEGMVKFFGNLGVSLENCEGLIALYIMNMPSFTVITRENFNNAIRDFKSVQDLGKHVRNEITSKYRSADLTNFKKFHHQAFIMAKSLDSIQTFLLIDEALDVIEVILNFAPGICKALTTQALIQFLQAKKASGELKALKKDEWNHMLDFLQAHPNSLKDYSDQEAWPVLYDRFVTWAKEQKPELF